MIPHDYLERVYAGVLGKIIGVYLGRPFEGWTYDRIMQELGEVDYYVNEKLGVPLVVTDDDISGTFTFLRALPDYGNRPDLTAAQVGQTWLNYVIEDQTILWWGGLGNSTEHTAFLRLKQGVPAPMSGSAALNGRIVAEQIGAQIFIDGWAMVAPGRPEVAADLARKAASVSHDGVAVHAAQLLAAMEAQAFVEADLQQLLEVGLSLIPPDSLLVRMVRDIQEWHHHDQDWRATRVRIEERYGYHRYGGNCHVIPNHAIIILSLLYSENSFQQALMIANTSGWDTDCNSGNIGCLMGIKNGLAGFAPGPDWRRPVADRLYLSSADGGRAITDAVREALEIVAIGRALAGHEELELPKRGARFHFELPGAVQGFTEEDNPNSTGTIRVENVAGHSRSGYRSLALYCRTGQNGSGGRVYTATFIPPEAVHLPGYALIASPTLYAGQTVRARLVADRDNISAFECCLYVEAYGDRDALERTSGSAINLTPDTDGELIWRVPGAGAAPIARVGLELKGAPSTAGVLYLDYLTWDGAPNVVFNRLSKEGAFWRRAWVNAVDHFEGHWSEAFRLSQNRGRGLLIQGTREWYDYEVGADIEAHAAKAVGLAARVQGLERYYALLLSERHEVMLIRKLDGEQILARVPFAWEYGERYRLSLRVVGNSLTARVGTKTVLEVVDPMAGLDGGGVALVCEEGTLSTEAVTVVGID